jgi:hypothetical protein
MSFSLSELGREGEYWFAFDPTVLAMALFTLRNPNSFSMLSSEAHVPSRLLRCKLNFIHLPRIFSVLQVDFLYIVRLRISMLTMPLCLLCCRSLPFSTTFCCVGHAQHVDVLRYNCKAILALDILPCVSFLSDVGGV